MKATKSYLLKLSLLVCMLFSLMAVTANAATVYKTPDGKFSYTVSSSKATIRSINGINSAVTIPDKVAHPTKTGVFYPVVTLGNGTTSIIANPEDVKTVVIPDTVTKIAANAFSGATGLKNVTLGANVVEISDKAFYGCPSLTEFICNSKVGTIGESAFSGCTKLTRVVFSPCLLFIGENAFKNCTALAHVADMDVAPADLALNHPSDLIRYGASITYDNYLPATLSEIGSRAFYGTALQDHLVIPSSVVSIGESAFQNCKSLKSVYLTTGVEVIDDNAFKGCTALENLFAPKSLGYVSETAFAGGTLDDTGRTKVYLFEDSYIDDELNSTKQYKASMFKYISVPHPATPIVLAPHDITLWAGETADINLSYITSPVAEISDSVTWKASSSAIIFVKRSQSGATISSTKAGTGYEVKASMNDNVDDTVSVTVKAAPTSLVLKKDGDKTAKPTYAFNIKTYPTVKFVAETAPVNGAPITSWTSSDKTIATVASDGTVTSTGKEGTVLISAKTYNGITTKVEVTFKYVYDDIKQKVLGTDYKDPLQVVAGTKAQFNKVALPANMKFAVSDTSIATLSVDSANNGYINAIKAGVIKVKGYDTVSNPAQKLEFTVVILPKKHSIKEIKKTSSGTKVIWPRRPGVSGHQIQYRKASSSKYTTVEVKPSLYYRTFKDLKKNVYYYFRIRSYISYNGKKYPGAWSTAVKYKVK